MAPLRSGSGGRRPIPSRCGAAGDGSRLSGNRNRRVLMSRKPAVVMAVSVSRLVWQPTNKGGPDDVGEALGPGQAGGVGLDVLEEAKLATGA